MIPRTESTIEEVVLKPRRVSTKRAGGSSFHFSVLSAVGDRAGNVGIALAKSTDMSSAIRKSLAKAKSSMVKIYITDSFSIPHEIRIKNGAAQLYLKPAPLGTGIIAGSVIRQILDIAGIRNISAKVLGTNNQINNAYTLMKALKSVKKSEEKE